MKNVKVSVSKWNILNKYRHNEISNTLVTWKYGHVVAAVLSRAQLCSILNILLPVVPLLLRGGQPGWRCLHSWCPAKLQPLQGIHNHTESTSATRHVVNYLGPNVVKTALKVLKSKKYSRTSRWTLKNTEQNVIPKPTYLLPFKALVCIRVWCDCHFNIILFLLGVSCWTVGVAKSCPVLPPL